MNFTTENYLAFFIFVLHHVKKIIHLPHYLTTPFIIFDLLVNRYFASNQESLDGIESCEYFFILFGFNFI